jgi:hypothetical protein
VTVCIAARADGIIVGASDRMLTSGDIQFEPATGAKIIVLTSSIFLLEAGDSSIQAEISSRVLAAVRKRVEETPREWWRVSDVVDLYLQYYNEVRNKRAEIAILSSFGLTIDLFVHQDVALPESLIKEIATELINYKIPTVETIVAGVDEFGPHIWTIDDNRPNCVDTVGFAAIGVGARHASSQFMLARHSWNSPFPDTLLLTYVAKKRSEVAPGVGVGTDMLIVGPHLGTLLQLGPHVVEKLESETQKLKGREATAFADGLGEIRNYVEELARQAEAAASSGQAAPKDVGGATSSDEPKTQLLRNEREREREFQTDRNA